MNGTRSDIKAMFADLKGLSPAKFSRLIDALWRDFLVLYAENKICYSDLHLLDPTDPNYDERYRYTRNKFTNPAGEMVHSWGTTQGYGHSILADFAQVYGFFNYAVSQFETVMGPYAEPVNQAIDPQQPKTWRNTDRLFTLGNGENESTRSNALVIFKSGLAEWFNATVFGKYKHENDGVPVLPKDGTLQFTPENDFEYWKNSQWNTFKGEKGDKGDKGDTGNTGPQGAQGEKGEPGDPAPDKYYTLTDTPAAPPATPERGFAIVTQAGEVQKHRHATALGEDENGPWFTAVPDVITYGTQIIPAIGVTLANGWAISAENMLWQPDGGAWFTAGKNPTGITGYVQIANISFVQGQNYEVYAMLALEYRTTDHKVELQIIGAQSTSIVFADLHLQQSCRMPYQHTLATGTYTVRISYSNFATPYSGAILIALTITLYSITAGGAMRATDTSGQMLYRLPAGTPEKGDAILTGDNGMLYFGKVKTIIPNFHPAAAVDDNSTTYATITPEQVFAFSEAVRNLFAALVSGTAGDILYHNGTTWVKLPKGTNGHILKLVSNIPAWAAESSGGGVPGTEELTYAATVTINWNGNTTKNLTLTGACDLALGTPANYVVRVEITGNHALTIPTSGVLKVEGSYDGAGVNVIDFIPTYSGVTVIISN